MPKTATAALHHRSGEDAEDEGPRVRFAPLGLQADAAEFRPGGFAGDWSAILAEEVLLLCDMAPGRALPLGDLEGTYAARFRKPFPKMYVGPQIAELPGVECCDGHVKRVYVPKRYARVECASEAAREQG